MEGLIVRSLGGFYTVISEDGTKTECRGRGIFRRDATTLLARLREHYRHSTEKKHLTAAAGGQS